MNQAVSEARKNVNWSSLSHRISFWKPILDKLNSTIIPIQAAVEFLEVFSFFIFSFLQMITFIKFKVFIFCYVLLIVCFV